MNLFAATAQQVGGRVVLHGSGWHVHALPDLAAALERGHDGGLKIGVRPEHVHVRHAGDGPSSPGEVRAEVAYREPRGDTDIITLILFTDDGQPSQRITAEIPGPTPFRESERAVIAIRPEHVHIFASDTGRRISVGSA
jgi:ABC-type sugar transport system ATPase subunit